ncbi:MAG: TetR/AcrR family transcriptional regulator [Syntrophales bacterium]|jgi:AcrR family transcriptional regulator|nr:TetR/AcrR family transcriptional regulator [Syntrophales bacterium]MDY0045607.1 TetR/AcrR family transcriptional regulator [Syntrophales bacterium]
MQKIHSHVNRIDKKRNETDQRILEAAKEVFAESGFSGARVDEIASRAKINKATIYYHIGDKKKLYEEVLHRVIGNIAEKITVILDENGSPEEKLRLYIRTVSKTMDSNPEMAPIIMREIASGANNLPEVIPEDLLRIVGLLSRILQEGKDEGIFTEVSPLVIHLMVIGVLLFYKAGAKIHDTNVTLAGIFNIDDFKKPAEIILEIERLILSAVTGRPESSPAHNTRNTRKKGALCEE